MKKLLFSDPGFAANITVRFLPDGKLVTKIGQTNLHYTFHPGFDSGSIDIHETDEFLPEGSPSRHRTLWRQPRTQVMETVRSIGPCLVSELMSLFRPIRLGWIVRRGLAIGPRIPSDLGKVNKISIRSGPATSADSLPTCFSPPEFYEDVLRPPLGGYVLFKHDRYSNTPYGLMVTYFGERSEVQMRWTKLSDVRQLQARWEPVVFAALQI